MEEGRFDGYEQGKADARRSFGSARPKNCERRAAESQRDAGAARVTRRPRRPNVCRWHSHAGPCAARSARSSIRWPAAPRAKRPRRHPARRRRTIPRLAVHRLRPSFDAASASTLRGRVRRYRRGAAVSPPATTEGISSRRVRPPGRLRWIAVPLCLSGQLVAVLYAEVQSKRQKEYGRGARVLARHAARCLEAVTALSAARLLTDSRDLALAGGSARNGDNGRPTKTRPPFATPGCSSPKSACITNRRLSRAGGNATSRPASAARLHARE